MVHHKTQTTSHPTIQRTVSWPTLFLAACLLAVWTLAAGPALAGDTGPTPAAPERQDNAMGTMHEGITMESGPGQDTVILISPPPQPQENEGDDTLPYGIQPKMDIDPKDYIKKK